MTVLTAFHLDCDICLVDLAHLLDASPTSKFQIFDQRNRYGLEEALSEAGIRWW